MQYIIYDFETTGLDHQKDQPIEIGIIKIDENGEREEYDIFIKPPAPLSEDIKRITGITDELLAEKGIDIEPAMKAFFYVLGLRPDGYDKNITIIGHNIIGFDNLFLRRYAEKYGYQVPPKEHYFDTAGEFRAKLLNEEKYQHENDHDFHERILRLIIQGVRYNLTAACQHYEITMDKDAHRADADCLYTLQIFEKQKGIQLLKPKQSDQPQNAFNF
ncbi:MAG: 3'-5' exonuclease [Candidatus Falkowbacteria bacterium]